MDLLTGYGSNNDDDSSDDEVIKAKTQQTASTLVPVATRADRRYLRAAPTVSARIAATGGSSSTALTIHNSNNNNNHHGMMTSSSNNNGGELVLMNNPSKSVLYEPVQGPLPDPTTMTTTGSSKIPGQGDIQANDAFDETTFQTQRTTFQRTGNALAPDTQGTVIQRTTLGYNKERLRLFQQQQDERNQNKRPYPYDDSSSSGKKQQKEPLVYGSDDEVEFGIWAPPSKEERWSMEQTVTAVEKGGVDSLAPQQLAEREYLIERDRQRGIDREKKEQQSSFERLMERKMAHLLPPDLNYEAGPIEATSQFHGPPGTEVDYKGQSWMAPPSGMGSVVGEQLEMDHHTCYIPKKCIHRYNTVNKSTTPSATATDNEDDDNDKKNNNNNKKQGIHRIRLFPKTGHLLLAAGLDGICRIFKVDQEATSLKLMRSYHGHNGAVRDVQFNHDGTKFVSVSFDRYIRLWDVETGQVLQTFSNGKVPFCVQFYPYDDQFFVVGCSDNKIVTYDCKSGEITQEYNHHLAPINSIIFTQPDDSSTETIKMITSSDDKKILVWEWDIGVPIKYISDPTMHSMPVLKLHPSRQYFVGQSLDNNMVVFQCNAQRITMQRKKKFSGHNVAGYACEMAMSPDGQYLVCGDSNGKLFFWDWKRTRILQKYRAHDQGPAIACVWHPLQPSIVFTCGWDGIIKIWR